MVFDLTRRRLARMLRRMELAGLLSARSSTARTLTSALGVSAMTLYRDIRFLSDIGVVRASPSQTKLYTLGLPRDAALLLILAQSTTSSNLREALHAGAKCLTRHRDFV